MLEQGVLLLRPWTAIPAAGGEERAVHDPATQTIVGWVRRLPKSRGWRGWFRTPRLQIHEAGDEPLLFTMRRIWGIPPRWEVRDADQQRVGFVRRGLIQNRFNRGLALVELLGGTRGVRFHNGYEGVELARLLPQSGGAELTFAPACGDNPFVKMLLVAAAVLM